MNKVILMGRLTKDPEVRYSQSAEPVAVARYTLAVNKRFKRDNEPDADFINCVSFGKGAEFMEKFFKKGMQILITGRITVRQWDDTNGQRHWITEVVAEDHEFTESKGASDSRGGQQFGGYPQQPGFPQASGYQQQPNYQQPQDYPKPMQQQPQALPPGSQQPSAFDNNYSFPSKQAPAYEPEGFSAIAESIDDDDLPF